MRWLCRRVRFSGGRSGSFLCRVVRRFWRYYRQSCQHVVLATVNNSCLLLRHYIPYFLRFYPLRLCTHASRCFLLYHEP